MADDFPREPQTPAEWQVAADLAETFLLIDSARQYGLVIGGPTVVVDRCVSILRRAKAAGIEPRDEFIDALIAAMVRAGVASEEAAPHHG